MELQLKDLETVETRAAKIRKAAATGDKEAARAGRSGELLDQDEDAHADHQRQADVAGAP